jgi:hypothetical protein
MNMEEYIKLKKHLEVLGDKMEEHLKVNRAYEILSKVTYSSIKEFNDVWNRDMQEIANLQAQYGVVIASAQKKTVCLLIDETKNIWLSRLNDDKKDCYGCIQSVEDVCKITSEGMETYERCAIRNIKETTGIDIAEQNLREICEYNYFLDYGLIECKIFYVCIFSREPERVKPEYNDIWYKTDLKKFGYIKNISYSIKINLEIIKRKINNYRVSKRDRESVNNEESNKRVKLDSDDSVEEGEIKEDSVKAEDEIEVDYN